MKKHILASLLTLIIGSSFAADNKDLLKTNSTEPSKKLLESNSAAKGFVYVRMNVADPQADRAPQWEKDYFLPGLGLGYRRGNHVDAIDLSIGVNIINTVVKRENGETTKEKATYWSFPKMSYLRYFSPKRASSFYCGLGLSWGGLEVVKQETEILFFGIIPTACLGYESNRKDSSWRSFFQFEVSQPALAVKTRGDLPGPIAEISVGLGY